MSTGAFIVLALVVLLVLGAALARVLFWASSEDPRGPGPHRDDE